MEYKDYYKILGLGRDADEDEIKKAYRRLARKYHPDVSSEPNAEEHFKEVSEAYEVLRDTERRRAYDTLGSNWHAGQDFRPPPNWQGRAGGTAGSGAGVDFSDFFETLFGQMGSGGGFGGFQSRMRKGEDEHAEIQITLEQAYNGDSHRLTLRRGEQREALDVRIPVGVQSGQQIRLSGKGRPGLSGGQAGDLYLRIQVQPHRLFRLEGRDILLDLPLAPWEAALGASVTVPTLGGKVRLDIPAGVQSGKRLRLKGRGLPKSGDQFVIIQIVNPPIDDERVRRNFERMQSEIQFNPRAALD